jgi:hypothetical protein
MIAASETRLAQEKSEISRQKYTIQTFSRIPTSDRMRNRSTLGMFAPAKAFELCL